ncbi:MAG: polyamine aminopropyltransferase [Burkholderiaceae bacterium]
MTDRPLEQAGAAPAAVPPGIGAPAEFALLVSVFVVAACGLVYELIAGALASYLLGDSVLQFSTVIGAYLFAMGIGSYLSRYLDSQLPAHFLRIELLVGLIGGLMPAALFLLHAWAPAPFRLLLYGLVIVIGTLVGLEIPLVMRIMKRGYALKDLVSQVLTFDYLGALAVSLAFPLVLAPRLGMIRTGLLFGLMNAAVALWALWVFRAELPARRAHAAWSALVLAALGIAFVGADLVTRWGEDHFYGQRIVLAESSPYQRIVITDSRGQIRLFLNGNLQFSSRDEHRYHEALVHPAMSAHPAPRSVLILGGGDGLAAREILRYPDVERVTLVDLDARVTGLFRDDPRLAALNEGSLRSPRLRVVNEDAFRWLEDDTASYDVIVIDLPDPTNYSLGKLYTTAFYSLVEQRLAGSGLIVVQTTSPLYARQSFWTVARTIEAVGLTVHPYHALVPSFGDWGYLIAAHRPYRPPARFPAALEGRLRFLTPELLPGLFVFPADMQRVPAEVNRLDNQVLVRIFEREWGRVAPE